MEKTVYWYEQNKLVELKDDEIATVINANGVIIGGSTQSQNH